ncbi:MAG: hypothetical protein Q4F57_02455 [Weeksellaceae bacterium]|nr:hypothetical protein [Weeksellaceae bacterium]
MNPHTHSLLSFSHRHRAAITFQCITAGSNFATYICRCTFHCTGTSTLGFGTSMHQAFKNMCRNHARHQNANTAQS